MGRLSKVLGLVLVLLFVSGCSTNHAVKATVESAKVFTKKDEVVVIIRMGNRVADIYVAPHFYRPRATDNYRRLQLGNLKNPFNKNAKYGRAMLFPNLATAGIFLMEHDMKWRLDPQSMRYWMRILPKTSKVILKHFEDIKNKKLKEMEDSVELDCENGQCPDRSVGDNDGAERIVPSLGGVTQ